MTSLLTAYLPMQFHLRGHSSGTEGLPDARSLQPSPTYTGRCFKFRASRLRFTGSPIEISEFQLLDTAGNRIPGATTSLTAGMVMRALGLHAARRCDFWHSLLFTLQV